jgi:hypothetical protein
MEWVWRWAVRSNEDAVANARAASTALSRLRVEREEAEVYCRERYDVPAGRGRCRCPRRTGGSLI